LAEIGQKPPYSKHTGFLKVMPGIFSIDSLPRAKLLVELPARRYRLLTPEGRVPCVGDEVILDQGFTGPDGLPMVLVYFPVLGDSLYEAEIYESELE
jgi:hypothetical protein